MPATTWLTARLTTSSASSALSRDGRGDSREQSEREAAAEVGRRQREESPGQHRALDPDIDHAALLDQQFAERRVQNRRRHRDRGSQKRLKHRCRSASPRWLQERTTPPPRHSASLSPAHARVSNASRIRITIPWITCTSTGDTPCAALHRLRAVVERAEQKRGQHHAERIEPRDQRHRDRLVAPSGREAFVQPMRYRRDLDRAAQVRPAPR